MVPQADFLELKRHKLIFLNFGAGGKIVYKIDTAILAPQANFLQVSEQTKGQHK
jgi:hypothetical protein